MIVKYKFTYTNTLSIISISIKRHILINMDMEYLIIGSNTNVSLHYKYAITYDADKEYYKCSCPDFKNNCSKKKQMCKHISLIKTMDDSDAEYAEYVNRGISKTEIRQCTAGQCHIGTSTRRERSIANLYYYQTGLRIA
jgi:hypothetical protein